MSANSAISFIKPNESQAAGPILRVHRRRRPISGQVVASDVIKVVMRLRCEDSCSCAAITLLPPCTLKCHPIEALSECDSRLDDGPSVGELGKAGANQKDRVTREVLCCRDHLVAI